MTHLENCSDLRLHQALIDLALTKEQQEAFEWLPSSFRSSLPRICGSTMTYDKSFDAFLPFQKQKHVVFF